MEDGIKKTADELGKALSDAMSLRPGSLLAEYLLPVLGKERMDVGFSITAVDALSQIIDFYNEETMDEAFPIPLSVLADAALDNMFNALSKLPPEKKESEQARYGQCRAEIEHLIEYSNKYSGLEI